MPGGSRFEHRIGPPHLPAASACRICLSHLPVASACRVCVRLRAAFAAAERYSGE